MKHLMITMAFVCCCASIGVQAGPYVPGSAAEPLTAVSSTDVGIVGWASGVHAFLPGDAGDTSFQIGSNALGVANAATDSASVAIANLGRGGSIVLTFDNLIVDAPGADLAVFENGFNAPGGIFGELAIVEVSSNGIDFFTFPHFSWTDSPVAEFGTVDPTNISGFAGKYVAGQGTPFDLSVFSSAPGIDVNAVTHVRIVDVVGDGSTLDNSPELLGFACDTGMCPVYDPYGASLLGPNGFDLDAVAVLNQGAATVPLPASVYLLLSAIVFVGQQCRQTKSK